MVYSCYHTSIMDEEEGFFTVEESQFEYLETEISVEYKEIETKDLHQSQRYKDFRPRHIIHLPYSIAQQPHHSSTAEYSQTVFQAETKVDHTSKRGKKMGLLDKYFGKEDYRMVYCRMDTKSLNLNQLGDNFAANYVYLGQIWDYIPSEFTVLEESQTQESKANSLTFDSNFESGNLFMAFKASDGSYELILQNDTNTCGYTQWFYFSVRGFEAHKVYHFKIVNLMKKYSLFKSGHQPWLMTKEVDGGGYKWGMAGTVNSYRKSNLLRDTSDSHSNYYELSMSVSLGEGNVACLALMPPYTYSKLIHFLQSIQDPCACLDIIAHSISSNCVPILTIGQAPSTKPCIVIMARQHPGEVWSSFLVEEVIKKLLDSSPESRYLRQEFTFVILPMINVDGVIYGNFRCDVAGHDLNRRWGKPCKVYQPTILKIKKVLQAMSLKNKIFGFFDFHGHSKELGTFSYNCPRTCKALPVMFAMLAQEFKLESCTYGFPHSRMQTAREIMSSIVPEELSMTIETSFFGEKEKSWTMQSMANLALGFVGSIYSYTSGLPYREVSIGVANTFIQQNPTMFLGKESCNESDSEPEEFTLTKEQRIRNVTPRQRPSIKYNQSSKKNYLFFQKLRQLLDNENGLKAEKADLNDLSDSRLVPAVKRERRLTKVRLSKVMATETEPRNRSDGPRLSESPVKSQIRERRSVYLPEKEVEEIHSFLKNMDKKPATKNLLELKPMKRLYEKKTRLLKTIFQQDGFRVQSPTKLQRSVQLQKPIQLLKPGKEIQLTSRMRALSQDPNRMKNCEAISMGSNPQLRQWIKNNYSLFQEVKEIEEVSQDKVSKETQKIMERPKEAVSSSMDKKRRAEVRAGDEVGPKKSERSRLLGIDELCKIWRSNVKKYAATINRY